MKNKLMTAKEARKTIDKLNTPAGLEKKKKLSIRCKLEDIMRKINDAIYINQDSLIITFENYHFEYIDPVIKELAKLGYKVSQTAVNSISISW